MDKKDEEKKTWIEKAFENSFGGFSGAFSGKGGGYSIQVTQTSEGTVVNAKLSDKMNREKVKRQLKQKYPNAKIKIKGGKGGESRFKVRERKKLENTEKFERKEMKEREDEEEKEEKEEKKAKKKVEIEWMDETSS